MLFQQAVALHQQGRVFQADALCADALRADVRHHGAWHLRGLLAIQAGRIEQGIEWIERSLSIHPNQAAAHSNLGNALLDSGQPERALSSFAQALRIKPGYVVALYNRANALKALGRLDEALTRYDEVLVIQGDHALTHHNRALVLLELARPVEALASFERAIQWDPRSADAWCGRGNVLLTLQRLQEALESYGAALRVSPQHLQALKGAGDALLAQGRADEALSRYDAALALSPQHCELLCSRGATLLELRRYQESIQSLAQVLSLEPTHADALGHLFQARMACCDWIDHDSLIGQLRQAITQQRRMTNPLTPLLLPDAMDMALTCARTFALQRYPAQGVSGGEGGVLGAALAPGAMGGARAGQGRIRVAYVSADFGDHPVSQLLAGVLERHDRGGFEVIGVSLREAPESRMRARMRAGCDRFIEVGERSDAEAARWLRELGVDIAVDLMGFTQGLRLGIFAHRAAPVQVNYLGYAGTLGAPYMDYVLGDEVVIPAGQERWYAEQVVRLPHCYLPNDDRRPIAPLRPTRAQAGLPHEGVVFCAFTNTYKINPPMYEVWMRLLREVAGSVLWLRGVGEVARANLQREAQRRGVAAERLVFAAHVGEMGEHLARQGLADLYLDTLPYNAHSTACDALWAGVPVLTCAGGSFAGRVAASALTALGLPELITHSLQEYESRALQLAREPQRLQGLRERLAQHRLTQPLFDTAGYTRALESAYRHMHQRAARGEVAQSFSVAS